MTSVSEKGHISKQKIFRQLFVFILFSVNFIHLQQSSFQTDNGLQATFKPKPTRLCGKTQRATDFIHVPRSHFDQVFV